MRGTKRWARRDIVTGEGVFFSDLPVNVISFLNPLSLTFSLYLSFCVVSLHHIRFLLFSFALYFLFLLSLCILSLCICVCGSLFNTQSRLFPLYITYHSRLFYYYFLLLLPSHLLPLLFLPYSSPSPFSFPFSSYFISFSLIQ